MLVNLKIVRLSTRPLLSGCFEDNNIIIAMLRTADVFPIQNRNIYDNKSQIISIYQIASSHKSNSLYSYVDGI